MKEGVLHINGRPMERQPVLAGDICERGSGGAKRWRERLPNGVSHEILDCVENSFYDNTPEYRVPDAHYFMLGVNRGNSTDSRVLNHVGFVPFENLVGRLRSTTSDGKAKTGDSTSLPEGSGKPV